jgi:hypothetical protein
LSPFFSLLLQTNTFIYRAFKPVGAFSGEFYFKVKAGADLRKEEVVWQRIRDQFGPNEAATFFVEVGVALVAGGVRSSPD